MLEIDSKKYGFKYKTIWFNDTPFEVNGYDGVVFRACNKSVNMDGFSKQEFTTLIIDLKQDLDTIWKRMSKSSCRSAIRKAKREGVEILINQQHETFIEMNKSFRRAKGLPAFDLDTDFMKKHGTLLVSTVGETILGGQFYLNDTNNMRWLLGASKRLESAESLISLIGDANRLMIWEAIQYAQATEIGKFDMGGYYSGKADPQMEGINLFKRSFGGDIVTHYIYEKDYSMAYKLAKKGYTIYKTVTKNLQKY